MFESLPEARGLVEAGIVTEGTEKNLMIIAIFAYKLSLIFTTRIFHVLLK